MGSFSVAGALFRATCGLSCTEHFMHTRHEDNFEGSGGWCVLFKGLVVRRPAAHAIRIAGCSGGMLCMAVILCRFLLSRVTCRSRLPFH